MTNQINQSENHLQVAGTIIEQMGGIRRLVAMVGANHFVGDKDKVQFSFKGCRGMNKVVITLDPSDTYTMEFWYIKTNGQLVMEKKYSESGLYWDMLIETFEQVTGLYLRL